MPVSQQIFQKLTQSKQPSQELIKPIVQNRKLRTLVMRKNHQSLAKTNRFWLQSFIMATVVLWIQSDLPSFNFFRVAMAQPCPRETPMFGGTTLDGSYDEYQQYFIVDDDDLTRMTTFRYCVCCINERGVHEHFRGFQVGISSPVSGDSYQTFGTVNAFYERDTICRTHNFGQEELMYLQVFADKNDVEGIEWTGRNGQKWVSRANGAISGPKQQMKGRPIGFRVWMGKGGAENQPLLMAVVYNSCNCPASTYIGETQFRDMAIEAVVGEKQTQPLAYQENYIESVYNQNCGSYDIDYEPKLPFFRLSQSGTTDPRNNRYTDLGTLDPVSLEDVGQYQVTMRIFQDSSNPNHGYFSPRRGFIPDKYEEFTITVNPCQVQSLQSADVMPDLSYRIGEADTTLGTYSVREQPNTCGYEQSVVVTGLPSFVNHDEQNRFFTVYETYDESLVGAYPVTIKTTISVPTDYTKTAYKEVVNTQTFNIFVQPCKITKVEATRVMQDMSYKVGDPEMRGFYEFVQFPDFCQKPIMKTPTISGSEPFSHDLENSEWTIFETENLELIGAYPQTLRYQIEQYTDYTKTTTEIVFNEYEFTIFLEPCAVTNYAAIQSIQEIRYQLNSPSLTDGNYMFEQQPNCGYKETFTLINFDRVSSFMSHNEASQDFTVLESQDQRLIGEYTFTVKSEISVPTDHSKTAFTPFVIEFDILIIIDPCIVDSYFDTLTAQTIEYAIGSAAQIHISPYEFTQTPNCGYQETVSLKNLPSMVTHNPMANDFTVPKNADLSQIGLYSVTLISKIQVPQDAQRTMLEMKVEYTFDVIVQPCEVQDYIDTVKVVELRYNIGADPVTSVSYAFEEQPFCGYPKYVTISNLPLFAQHNEQTADFTIKKSSELGLVGEYIVNIKGSIQIPTDYRKDSYFELSQDYDFKIYIDPCLVTDYSRSPAMSTIEYSIGEPSKTEGFYAFKESPACNYPETVDVSNVPDFVTHNPETFDFTINRVNDVSLIGEYFVTIRSQIEMPKDHTRTEMMTLFDEYDFSIKVQPCLIDEFSVSPFEKMTYTIGERAKASPRFSFTQKPSCDYPEKYVISGLDLAPFVKKIKGLKQFYVEKTDDLSLAGSYYITVRKEFEQPLDYTKKDNLIVANEFTFEVEMINPCYDSKMATLLIDEMDFSFKSSPKLQQIKNVQDQISQKYGAKDGLTFCGPRYFELIDDPSTYENFLTLDKKSNMLTVQTDEIQYLGQHEIKAKVSLLDYPQVYSVTTFTVTIDYCQVIDLKQTPVLDQEYKIFTPAISFSVAKFTQTPKCEFNLDYIIRIKDFVLNSYRPLPSFIQVSKDLEFSVYSDNRSTKGSYDISIIGSVPDGYQSPVYSEELLFKLNLVDQCISDKLIVEGTIDDQLYYIAEDGIKTLTPKWKQRYEECPSTFEIGRIVDGFERLLSPEEKKVIQLNPTDGRMRFKTENFGLDGETWTIRLYMKSTKSMNDKQEASYVFDIEFRDICWDSDLEAAQFKSSSLAYNLWQNQALVYDEMTDLSQPKGHCGGYTTELVYLSGPAYNKTLSNGADLSFYSLKIQDDQSFAYVGTIEDFSWIGSHNLILKSTLGKKDESPSARGDKGLYNTVYSQKMKLMITNPCVHAVVNADGKFALKDLKVPITLDRESVTYKGPSNSVSVLYGNGYNRCGPLKYSFLGLNGQLFSLEQFSTNVKLQANNFDELSMTLTSARTGTIVKATTVLKMELEYYPTAVAASFKVELTYRECAPFDFSGPNIEERQMYVSDDGFEQQVLFNQAPCSYPQEYAVKVYDLETGVSIVKPTFMSSDGSMVYIDTPERQHVGEYQVKVCSQLTNSIMLTECSSFNIKVQPRPNDEDIIYEKDPEFIVVLQDLKVRVGDSISYSPGADTDTFGYRMEIDLFLADAYKFSTYDPLQNIFRVDGGKMRKDDIGVYPITMTATFTKDEKNQKYRKVFLLTVWDVDPPIEEKDWFPDEPIEYSEWQPENIVREIDTQKQILEDLEGDDIDRPIPYIVDLKPTGLLTIGWNTEMNPPLNFTEIPPTKVAFEENLDLDGLRFWENRRWLRSYSDFEVESIDPEFVYFGDYTDKTFERMQLVDALEVRITPDDPEVESNAKFTWDILGYNQDFIKLQLIIENPWDISADQQLDTLSVTFWGVDYFRSVQNKEVKYGTTLYWPILRQISIQEKEMIDHIHGVIASVTGASLFVVAPIIVIGSLLPTWMFINALSIIAHMILLNTVMPASTHYFLKEYLDWLRWYNENVTLWLDQEVELKRYSFTDGAYNALFKACDYDHLLAKNMIIILLVFAVILLTWLSFCIKDRIQRQNRLADNQKGCCRSRSAPCCQNFTLRFVYEFFLEFCICVMLQLSVMDTSEFSSLAQFAISAMIAISTLALLIFVLSLLCYGGPWVPDFFMKGTSVSSVTAKRKINPDFDIKTYLEDKNKETRKPWGYFFISLSWKSLFDCCKKKPQVHPQSTQKLVEQQNDNSIQTERNLLSPQQTQRNSSLWDIETLSSATRHSQQKYPHMSCKSTILSSSSQATSPQGHNRQDMRQEEAYLSQKQLMNMASSSISSHHDSILIQAVEEMPEYLEQSSLGFRNKSNQQIEQNQEVQNHAGPQLISVLDYADQNTEREIETEPKGRLIFEGGETIPSTEQGPESGQIEAVDTSEFDSILDDDLQMDPTKRDRQNWQTSIQDRRAHKEARIRLAIEDTVERHPGYKTLFYGLKQNHERNVAVIHPLMFLLRRIVFAAVVVFMGQVTVLPIFVILVSTLLMLGYALSEHQWKSALINSQHIFNEIMIYLMCVLLLCFNNFCTPIMRQSLGFVMIGMCLCFVAYNTIVIAVYSMRQIWVFVRRIVVQNRRKKSRQDVIQTVQKLNKIHTEIKENMDNGGWLGDFGGSLRPYDTGFGGFFATFIKQKTSKENDPFEPVRQVTLITNKKRLKKKSQPFIESQQTIFKISLEKMQKLEESEEHDFYSNHEFSRERTNRNSSLAIEEEKGGQDLSYTYQNYQNNNYEEMPYQNIMLTSVETNNPVHTGAYINNMARPRFQEDSNGNGQSMLQQNSDQSDEMGSINGLIKRNTPIDLTDMEQLEIDQKKIANAAIDSDVVSEAHKPGDDLRQKRGKLLSASSQRNLPQARKQQQQNHFVCTVLETSKEHACESSPEVTEHAPSPSQGTPAGATPLDHSQNESHQPSQYVDQVREFSISVSQIVDQEREKTQNESLSPLKPQIPSIQPQNEQVMQFHDFQSSIQHSISHVKSLSCIEEYPSVSESKQNTNQEQQYTLPQDQEGQGCTTEQSQIKEKLSQIINSPKEIVSVAEQQKNSVQVDSSPLLSDESDSDKDGSQVSKDYFEPDETGDFDDQHMHESSVLDHAAPSQQKIDKSRSKSNLTRVTDKKQKAHKSRVLKEEFSKSKEVDDFIANADLEQLKNPQTVHRASEQEVMGEGLIVKSKSIETIGKDFDMLMQLRLSENVTENAKVINNESGPANGEKNEKSMMHRTITCESIDSSQLESEVKQDIAPPAGEGKHCGTLDLSPDVMEKDADQDIYDKNIDKHLHNLINSSPGCNHPHVTVESLQSIGQHTDSTNEKLFKEGQERYIQKRELTRNSTKRIESQNQSNDSRQQKHGKTDKRNQKPKNFEYKRKSNDSQISKASDINERIEQHSRALGKRKSQSQQDLIKENEPINRDWYQQLKMDVRKVANNARLKIQAPAQTQRLSSVQPPYQISSSPIATNKVQPQLTYQRCRSNVASDHYPSYAQSLKSQKLSKAQSSHQVGSMQELAVYNPTIMASPTGYYEGLPKGNMNVSQPALMYKTPIKVQHQRNHYQLQHQKQMAGQRLSYSPSRCVSFQDANEQQDVSRHFNINVDSREFAESPLRKKSNESMQGNTMKLKIKPSPQRQLSIPADHIIDHMNMDKTRQSNNAIQTLDPVSIVSIRQDNGASLLTYDPTTRHMDTASQETYQLSPSINLRENQLSYFSASNQRREEHLKKRFYDHTKSQKSVMSDDAFSQNGSVMERAHQPPVDPKNNYKFGVNNLTRQVNSQTTEMMQNYYTLKHQKRISLPITPMRDQTQRSANYDNPFNSINEPTISMTAEKVDHNRQKYRTQRTTRLGVCRSINSNSRLTPSPDQFPSPQKYSGSPHKGSKADDASQSYYEPISATAYNILQLDKFPTTRISRKQNHVQQQDDTRARKALNDLTEVSEQLNFHNQSSDAKTTKKHESANYNRNSYQFGGINQQSGHL